MLVSVIIPCYNQGGYIQGAIDSVKAQTYTNWEIIIVNDGSNDTETITVLKELVNAGVQVIDIKNSGVSVARNTAIHAAKGELILPLDADDKIEERYIQLAVDAFKNNDSLKLVYCNCEYFGTKTGLMQVPNFSFQGMLFENLIFNAALFKKKDFLQTAGYDPSFKIGWEDWDFWLSFIENENQVLKLEGIHFYYRIKAESRNSSLINENRMICEQQIFKKHIDKYLTIESNPITKLQEFNFYKTEYKKLVQYREALHQSWSYRIGNAILFPLKIIKRFIFK
jgi:glycosyltransferase involved in cell wall biosynthesis